MSGISPNQTVGIFYKTRVRDVASGDPVACSPRSTVREMSSAMLEHGVGAVVVVDEQGRPLGIVTERDLVYKVLAHGELEQTAADVMTSPAASIGPEDFVYQGLQLMLQRRCRRLVVVDASGRAVGLLSMPNLMRLQGVETRTVLEQVAKAGSIEELREVRLAGDDVIQRLFLADVDAETLGRLLSEFSDAVTRRILLLSIRQLKLEGRNQPRQGYCWVGFGSDGRQEQVLRGDQDNGMVLPDDIDEAGRGYYRLLAARVNEGLAAYGYGLCDGGVMAREDPYFGTVGEWKSRVTLLLSGVQDGMLLRRLTIYLDCRAVAGRLELGEQVRDQMHRAVGSSGAALRALAEDAVTKDPALNLLGRLRYEKDGDGRRGINIKRRGLLPLTAGVKAFAYDRGIRESGTAARIRALRDAGVLERDSAADLLFAHDLFLRLKLQSSLEQAFHGQTNTHFVYPDEWTEWERRDLRRSFKAVAHLLELLRFHFTL